MLLTFATDSLIDYLGDNEPSQKRLDALGFSLSASAIIEAKTHEPLKWRRVIQHDLHRQIHAASGARHYTPFFIRSPTAHRSYWLIHLSNHHRARDVMTQLHWESGNDFEHFGAAGLDMFGYNCGHDPLITGQQLFSETGFRFDEDARQATHAALLEDSPRKLSSMGQGGVTFDSFFAEVTNSTPATSQQLRVALNALAREGEVEIYSPIGTRRRANVAIDNNDQLCLSRQKSFLPPLSSGGRPFQVPGG